MSVFQEHIHRLLAIRKRAEEGPSAYVGAEETAHADILYLMSVVYDQAGRLSRLAAQEAYRRLAEQIRRGDV